MQNTSNSVPVPDIFLSFKKGEVIDLKEIPHCVKHLFDNPLHYHWNYPFDYRYGNPLHYPLEGMHAIMKDVSLSVYGPSVVIEF